jgi:hypothetical protein
VLGNYQTTANNALREFKTAKRPPIKESLRGVVREELAEYRRRK